MPALQCEALFQAGAAFVAAELLDQAMPEGVPVLTRIRDAKFKRMVRPGEVLDLEVKLLERVGPAYWLVGTATTEGQTVCRVEFACTLAPAPGRETARDQATTSTAVADAAMP